MHNKEQTKRRRIIEIKLTIGIIIRIAIKLSLRRVDIWQHSTVIQFWSTTNLDWV